MNEITEIHSKIQELVTENLSLRQEIQNLSKKNKELESAFTAFRQRFADNNAQIERMAKESTYNRLEINRLKDTVFPRKIEEDD